MSKALITTIFISLIIESVFSKHIVLNFRTNIDLNSLTEENYMSSTIEQQIYVDLKIGESKQTIPMTLKSMKYPTFIVSSNSTEEDILIKYDESKSKNSLKYLYENEIKNLFIYDFTQGYYVSDTLGFSSSNTYNNFSYILATKMNGIVKNISGEIGFSKNLENKANYIYPQKTNFIEQLYNNQLISKKIFGIKYDKEYEGRLILGATLDEISYGFLQFEFGLIIGSNNYYQNFILNYFETKQCTKNTIKSSSHSFYQYTCNNENQFNDFPDLNLSGENKYNFTFTKNDLFKKVGNKYFFLIVFQISQININYWRLGQLFFRKYPTFLSNDEEGKNGQFSYYSINKQGGDQPQTDETDGPKSDDSGNVGLTVALSILIPLIIIAAVLIFIYYYRERNKKLKSEALLKDSPTGSNDDSYPIIDN